MPTERTTGTYLEAAPGGGPRVTTAEEEKDNTAQAWLENEDEDVQDIVLPRENDVLFGRGGGTNHHPGNRRWRQLVEDRKHEYARQSRSDKLMVSQTIIDRWRAQVPAGRFLKKNRTTGFWNDVGNKKAREKTSQALREPPSQREEQQSPTRGGDRRTTTLAQKVTPSSSATSSSSNDATTDAADDVDATAAGVGAVEEGIDEMVLCSVNDDGDDENLTIVKAKKKNTPNAEKNYQQPQLPVVPCDLDVLCGGAFNLHPGNKRYRAFIELKKPIYNQHGSEKHLIARSVVEAIQEGGGRFLLPQEDEETAQRTWSELEEKKTVKKVENAFRTTTATKTRRTAVSVPSVCGQEGLIATAAMDLGKYDRGELDYLADPKQAITEEEAATHTYQQYCKMMSSYNAVEECDQYDIKDDVYLQTILRRCRTYSEQHNAGSTTTATATATGRDRVLDSSGDDSAESVTHLATTGIPTTGIPTTGIPPGAGIPTTGIPTTGIPTGTGTSIPPGAGIPTGIPPGTSALTHPDSMDFAVLVFLMNHYIAEINYRKNNNIKIFTTRKMVLCTIQAIHYAIGIVFNYDRVTLIYESIQRLQLIDGLRKFDNIFWRSGNTLDNIANNKPSIVGPLDGLLEDHGVYRDGIMSTNRLKDIVHDYQSIQEGEFRFLDNYTRYVCCFIEKPDGMLEIFNNRQKGNDPFFITVKNLKVPIVFFIVHGIVNKSIEKAIIGFRQQAIKQDVEVVYTSIVDIDRGGLRLYNRLTKVLQNSIQFLSIQDATIKIDMQEEQQHSNTNNFHKQIKYAIHMATYLPEPQRINITTAMNKLINNSDSVIFLNNRRSSELLSEDYIDFDVGSKPHDSSFATIIDDVAVDGSDDGFDDDQDNDSNNDDNNNDASQHVESNQSIDDQLAAFRLTVSGSSSDNNNNRAVNHSSIHAYWNNVQFHSSLVNPVSTSNTTVPSLSLSGIASVSETTSSSTNVRGFFWRKTEDGRWAKIRVGHQEHLESLLNELDLDDGLVAVRKRQRQLERLAVRKRQRQLEGRHDEGRVNNGRVRRKLTRICWKQYGLLLRPNTLSLLLIIMKTMNDQQFASLLTNIHSWLAVQQSWHHNSNTPAATTMIKNILTVTVVKDILSQRKKLRRRTMSKQLLDKIGACNDHYRRKQSAKSTGRVI